MRHLVLAIASVLVAPQVLALSPKLVLEQCIRDRELRAKAFDGSVKRMVINSYDNNQTGLIWVRADGGYSTTTSGTYYGDTEIVGPTTKTGFDFEGHDRLIHIDCVNRNQPAKVVDKKGSRATVYSTEF